MDKQTWMPLQAKRISPHDGKHYFFGYYDKLQFDPQDRYVLAQGVDILERPPGRGDEAEIGYIDLEDKCRWIAVGKTTAWCWRQG